MCTVWPSTVVVARLNKLSRDMLQPVIAAQKWRNFRSSNTPLISLTSLSRVHIMYSSSILETRMEEKYNPENKTTDSTRIMNRWMVKQGTKRRTKKKTSRAKNQVPGEPHTHIHQGRFIYSLTRNSKISVGCCGSLLRLSTWSSSSLSESVLRHISRLKYDYLWFLCRFVGA